jgi:hypothetical protein
MLEQEDVKLWAAPFALRLRFSQRRTWVHSCRMLVRLGGAYILYLKSSFCLSVDRSRKFLENGVCVRLYGVMSQKDLGIDLVHDLWAIETKVHKMWLLSCLETFPSTKHAADYRVYNSCPLMCPCLRITLCYVAGHRKGICLLTMNSCLPSIARFVYCLQLLSLDGSTRDWM